MQLDEVNWLVQPSPAPENTVHSGSFGVLRSPKIVEESGVPGMLNGISEIGVESTISAEIELSD